ncbi:fibronectin type III domain-containing protein [Sphaerisporangium sp. NPDC005288]|uniref:fibronectin type III domain-containing protein n=1 Tax=Sphaerisporangium sp. NPDC005288 TaxID=3155114 RepID=UPI0033B67805
MLTGGAATGSVAMAAVETHSSALKLAAHAAPDTQPPTAPRNLRLFERIPGIIILRWDPSSDPPFYPPPSGVVAYDIYASTSPFRLIGSVPGNVTTFIDRRRLCERVSYFVRARDAAGNVSPPSNVVTRHPHRHCGHHDEEIETPANSVDDIDRNVDDHQHHSDDHNEIIKADKLFHVEGADDHGGGHRDWSGHDGYGGHEFGGPGHEGAESEAGGDHGGGDHGGGQGGGGQEHAAAQPAGRSLPFTGAPVAAVAGAGVVLLVAGAAGVVISKRRRRTAGAR